MYSTVKPNGDVIQQSDLEAILGAEAALNALILNLKQRIADGARVHRGKYDVYVDEFRVGDQIDMEAETEFFGRWHGSFIGLDINLASELRAARRMARKVA